MKSDPTKADTDGDGLTDVQEVNITDNGPGKPRTITLKYNPSDADIDNDLRSDGEGEDAVNGSSCRRVAIRSILRSEDCGD